MPWRALKLPSKPDTQPQAAATCHRGLEARHTWDQSHNSIKPWKALKSSHRPLQHNRNQDDPHAYEAICHELSTHVIQPQSQGLLVSYQPRSQAINAPHPRGHSRTNICHQKHTYVRCRAVAALHSNLLALNALGVQAPPLAQ